MKSLSRIRLLVDRAHTLAIACPDWLISSVVLEYNTEYVFVNIPCPLFRMSIVKEPND